MGTRPEDLAERAAQLEADADGIRTQNERKLEMDDTKKRIEDVKERIVSHEVTAAQNRGLARKLREDAEDLKASVRGERLGPGDEQPTGNTARNVWRTALENEEKAEQLEKTADDEEAAAAAARTELEEYEERLETLQEEYRDAELMQPDDYDPAPTPPGNLELEIGEPELLASAMTGGVASDPAIDAENPEHPGFGPDPEDPTTDMETPEDPGYGTPPEDPTIDVETPEVPDLTLPEPGPPADGDMETAPPDPGFSGEEY